MLDEIDLAGYLQALRKRARENTGALHDTLTLIADACIAPDGEESDPMQIARTLLELAYSERLGLIRWITCKKCNVRLEDEDDKSIGLCADCLLKEMS